MLPASYFLLHMLCASYPYVDMHNTNLLGVCMYIALPYVCKWGGIKYTLELGIYMYKYSLCVYSSTLCWGRGMKYSLELGLYNVCVCTHRYTSIIIMSCIYHVDHEFFLEPS